MGISVMARIGVDIWVSIFGLMTCHKAVPLTCRYFLGVSLDPSFSWKPLAKQVFKWTQPIQAASSSYGGLIGGDRDEPAPRRHRPSTLIEQEPSDQPLLDTTAILEVAHDSLFSSVVLELEPDLQSIKAEVLAANQSLALCWGANGPCCCLRRGDRSIYNRVFDHGRYLMCLCFEPQRMCSRRGGCIPCKIHCCCTVCDSNCRVPLECCCMDLPSVGSYNNMATTALDANIAAFVKMVVHTHWESSLPEGLCVPDPDITRLELDQYDGIVPPSALEFLAPLQQNWEAILAEFDEAIEKAAEYYIDWSDEGLHYTEGGWKVFGLVAYGEALKYNQTLCPLATKLLKGIPNLCLAGFSTLLPGTHLLPQ